MATLTVKQDRLQLTLSRRELLDHQRLPGDLIVELRAQPALLAQLRQREGAAGRVEQVRRQQRVVGDPRRHRVRRRGLVDFVFVRAPCKVFLAPETR